jgi:hypothetical protein
MIPELSPQVPTNVWGTRVADLPYPFLTEIGTTGPTFSPGDGGGFGRVRQGYPNPLARRPPVAVETLTSNTLGDPSSDTLGDPTLPLAIASNWSRLALFGIGPPLYARLMNLAKREPGWRGLGSRPLDSGSLRVFLEFWKLIRDSAVEPQIVLGANGHIQAIWQRNSRRSLDLEFTASGAIYFGLFDGPSIQEGVDTADQLANVLLNRKSEPLKWR